MREPFHPIRINRKTVFYFVAILMTLAGVTPVLADYLGPNRTVTETTSVCKVILYKCQYVPAKGDYRYHKTNSWSCADEGKPWQAYPSQPARDCANGVDEQYWEREDIVQEATNTYPPATISSVLDNCTLNNGWCVTAPQLSLSGYEPVAGHSIIAIEGSLNGQTFACQNASCVVPLNEGDNSLAYWALSSFLDSSEMGTLTAKVDSQLPNISGTWSGISGLNGWYLSPINFTGSASDATSGLTSFTCTLDSNPLGSCSSITVNGEGAHTLVLNARDNAGNTRTLTQNASLDTQNPTLNASFNGTLGANSWYTAAVLNAAASDATPGSGLSTFEYNLDNGNWVGFPASGILALSDGKHTLDIRAIDDAGRTTTSSKSFWLDTIAPGVSLIPSGTPGSNNWYISNLNIAASASDGTSGIDIFEYSLDTNSWAAYTNPLTLTDGSHSLSFWAQDQAGLVKQVDRNYQVDTRPPQIGGSISGVTGINGWYTSDVTVSASVSDPLPGSGVDAFTYILNNSAATPYANPLSLGDGQHTIQFNAQDQAGLTDSVEQHIKVDTVHPTLAISTTFPNWVKNEITLAGTVGDNGSGLSRLQISTDGGQTWQALTGTTSWNHDWNTANNSDGSYRVHVRATDNAGLMTEKTLNVDLDNHAPKISLPDSWFQWDTVTLDVWDNYSGLADTRVEISDPDGRWPKRIIELDEDEFPLSFKWDRRFGDDTVAPLGTYDLKVIARDRLGNMSHAGASIKILLGILPAGPTATPQPSSRDESTPTPASTATPISSPTITSTPVISIFGEIDPTAQVIPTPAISPTPRGTPTQTGVLDWWESFFEPNTNAVEQVSEITSPALESSEFHATDPESNVLWGAAAAAMVGSVTAYALEERRKQEEAKAYQAALEAEAEERREKMQAHKIEKMDAERKQEAAWEAARQKQEQEQLLSQVHQAQLEARMEQRDAEDEAKWMASEEIIRQRAEEQKKAEEEKKKAEELKNGLAAYYNGRKQGEPVAPTKEESWWEKTLDFVDQHQQPTAIGIGVAIGAAAIAITLAVAVTITLPVVALAVGAAALTTAVVIGAGTVGLNNHFDRDLMTNVWSNILSGAVSAAVVSGVGLLAFGGLLTKVTLTAGNAIGGWCLSNPSACARIEPVMNALDTGEQLWLGAKMAYQTWRHDPAAQDTALEIQMEQLDGGIPGNTVSKEIDEVVELGEDAVHAFQKYGDDVIPLLLKYREDALDIINTYGDDGFEILLKYGDAAVDLVHDHGPAAVKVLTAVGSEAGEKLLKNLDDDVLEYTMQEGSDAVDALSRWSAEDLKEHGVELALRSKKDAQVLSDVKKLVSLKPIDPKHLTEEQKALIDAIAANSTQYADEEQVVLGKWVDISNGFVETAKDTGSVHYNPHPDMWKLLGNLGKEDQSEVAWLVNRQVVQTGINKGLPFEYTLNGVPAEIISNEQAAIKAIFTGNPTNAQIQQLLKSDYVPIRMKELQELQKAGYEYVFDEVNNAYVFVPK